MSPEEASGATPSEASDWYGVGVTLYEALTGTLPFAGPVADVLLRKTDERSAALRRTWRRTFRPDLSAICMGLLRRDPEAAPVRARGPLAAGTRAPRQSRRRPRAAPIRDTPFVGRDRQLHALDDGLSAVTNGRATAVSVHGPSGIGKSALVRRFLEPVRRARRCGRALRPLLRERVRPLQGARRRDRRSEPLSRLDSAPSTSSSLLPPDVPALTRVFPVLLQVRAIATRAAIGRSAIADPFVPAAARIRGVARTAGPLANRQPLVIWIDDLQWADADSVVLLEELLRPPDPPAMLTVLCFRSEETPRSRFSRRCSSGQDGRVVGDLARADDRRRSRRPRSGPCFRPTRRSPSTTDAA